jgi:hypothetical protein
MADLDRDQCRANATECMELARATNDPILMGWLQARAQEWLKISYADTDAEFLRLLEDFNGDQLGFREQPPVHRQPMQQQQKKKEDGK